MIKNIIVPIDFSEDSIKGLQLAMLFAKKNYVNIQMVYVQKKSSDYYPSTLEEEKKFAENNFEKIIKEYAPQLENDSKLRYIIKQGKIYTEVVNQAQSYKDCFIMASTHGASGFEEFFIGSNAHRIITTTDKPVITLRKGSCPKEIKKIVLTVDTRKDTRQKVPLVVEMAKFFGAGIHIVGLSKKNIITYHRVRAYMAQVAGYINNRVPYTRAELQGDNLAALLVRHSHEENADLISIMTERVSGVNLILGSFAHQVLNKSEIPVLSITPKPIRIKTGFKTTGGG
jgi:nucleotide-binding universal stress UspA family protein